MNEQNTTNQPVETIRDGSLKATIWQNQGENGPYFTTTLAKTYEDRDGKLRDTYGFTGSELLRVAELARTAYAQSIALRREPEPQVEPQREEPRRRGGNTSGYARRRSHEGLSECFPGFE